MSAKEFYSVLQKTGLPAAYGFFEAPQDPPYLVYMGDGQTQFAADNTRHYYSDQYTVEYYYTRKDPDLEEKIEQTFLDAGLRYDKSEDAWIEDERVFIIYYYVN